MSRFIQMLVVVATLVGCTKAVAGEWLIHTATTHYKAPNLEHFTPGIAYTTGDGYRFGALSNSYRKPSIYAAKIYPINSRLRFGVGAISGYSWDAEGLQGNKYGAIPLLAAEYDITEKISVIWFIQALNLEIKF